MTGTKTLGWLSVEVKGVPNGFPSPQILLSLGCFVPSNTITFKPFRIQPLQYSPLPLGEQFCGRANKASCRIDDVEHPRGKGMLYNKQFPLTGLIHITGKLAPKHHMLSALQWALSYQCS